MRNRHVYWLAAATAAERVAFAKRHFAAQA